MKPPNWRREPLTHMFHNVPVLRCSYCPCSAVASTGRAQSCSYCPCSVVFILSLLFGAHTVPALRYSYCPCAVLILSLLGAHTVPALRCSYCPCSMVFILSLLCRVVMPLVCHLPIVSVLNVFTTHAYLI